MDVIVEEAEDFLVLLCVVDVGKRVNVLHCDREDGGVPEHLPVVLHCGGVVKDWVGDHLFLLK